LIRSTQKPGESGFINMSGHSTVAVGGRCVVLSGSLWWISILRTSKNFVKHMRIVGLRGFGDVARTLPASRGLIFDRRNADMSKIIIQLQGGLVADVFVVGTGTPTEIIVIDEDTDGVGDEDLTMVKLGKRGTYEAVVHSETPNPLPEDSDVAKMVRAFDKARLSVYSDPKNQPSPEYMKGLKKVQRRAIGAPPLAGLCRALNKINNTKRDRSY
jgi:hypothetical protein